MAAGAAIGVTVAGLFKLADGADQLADKAGRIRDFGQQVGLTVAQVQALEIAGADVGLKAEKIAAGLGKLSAEMEQTRRGTGALFEEAQRISPEFAEQLARARDLTQFIDRLSKAWDGLTESQRNALSKAALGRGIDLGRLFGQVNEAGGLAALEQGLSKTIVLTNDQAKALDDLKDSAERLRTSAWDRFVSIFAESQLKAQLETAQGLDWISRSLKAISEIDIKQSVLDLFGFVTGRSGGPAVKLPDELDALKAQLKAAEDNRARLGPGRMGTIADATIAELRARIEAIERATQGAPADVPLPQPRPAQPDPPLSAEAQLNIERQRMAVLGAAATPAEQLQLKMKELAAATDNWSRNQNEGNRALEAFIQGQARAAVATRTRLGIVTEEELITRGLNDLQELRRNGFIKSAEEMAMAERIMRKEVVTTSEAMKVRNSDFPALTRLATDADKLALNLDQDLASALHSSTSDLIDMAKGTETLSAGLDKPLYQDPGSCRQCNAHEDRGRADLQRAQRRAERPISNANAECPRECLRWQRARAVRGGRDRFAPDAVSVRWRYRPDGRARAGSHHAARPPSGWAARRRQRRHRGDQCDGQQPCRRSGHAAGDEGRRGPAGHRHRYQADGRGHGRADAERPR